MDPHSAELDNLNVAPRRNTHMRTVPKKLTDFVVTRTKYVKGDTCAGSWYK